MSTITRIRGIQLRNFRGWGQRPGEVDTDADLVLVTGGNGYGKSSLLEALVLLLTGERVNKPPADVKEEFSQLCHRGTSSWGVEASVLAEDGPAGGLPSRLSIAYSEQQNQVGSKLTWTPEWEEELRRRDVPGDLLKRSIFFVQDNDREALDETSTNAPITLESWFVRVGPEIVELSRTTDAELDRLQSMLRLAEQDREVLSEPSPDLPVRAEAYWREAQTSFENLPRIEDPSLEGIDAWCRARLDALQVAYQVRAEPEVLLDRLTAELTQRGKAGDWTRIQEARARLQKRTDELQSMPSEGPARALLSWAAPEDEATALDQLITALSNQLRHWKDTPCPDPRLEPVTAEFRRLDLGKLQALAATLAQVVGEARRALADRQQVEAAIEREQLVLASLGVGASPALAAAGRALRVELLNEQRRRIHLDGLRKLDLQAPIIELQRLKVALDRATQPATVGEDGALQVLIETALDNTLVRFHPRPGLLPMQRVVKTDPTSRSEWREFTTGDGGPWSDLSTGQKAQLNLAWMLAQAEALRSILPFRVLLLDDTSTAFDQSNLARQAIWLRQLAYHRDQSQRWQVFLVSHHDALTSRLVEFLRPPPGCKMRILDFNGWKPGYGPLIQEWELAQADQTTSTEEEAQRLAKALKMTWTPPREDSGDPREAR